MTKMYAHRIFPKTPLRQWLLLFTCWMGLSLATQAQTNEPPCTLSVEVGSLVNTCNGGAVCFRIGSTAGPLVVFIISNTVNLRDTFDANANICFRNLRPGNYTMRVLDAQGCSGGVMFEVPRHEETVFEARVKPVSCHGGADGAIDLQVPIDVAPIFFRWEGPDGFSADTEDIRGLKAGVYNVQVFGENGVCYGVGKWEVTQPRPVKIDIAISQPTCGGARVCAMIGGGTAPYRVWGFKQLPAGVNNSNFLRFFNFDELDPADAQPYNPDPANPRPFCMEDLPSDTYYIIVRDANGCFSWKIFRVNNAANFQQRIETTNPGCTGANDGKICFRIISTAVLTPNNRFKTTLTMSAGSEQYTLEGTSGCFENLGPGEYILTTTSSTGCTATERVRLSVASPVEAEFVLSDNDCANGASGCLRVSGGTRPYRIFAWTHPGNDDDDFEIGFFDNGTPYVLNAERSTAFNFPPVLSQNTPFCARNIRPGRYILIVADLQNCFKAVVVTIPNVGSSNIRARFEITNQSCDAGASACLTVLGGEPPYDVSVWKWDRPQTIIPPVEFRDGVPVVRGATQVRWNWAVDSTASNYRLCADNIEPGTYFILVVDQTGCYQLVPAFVPPASGLRLVAQATDVLCNGDATGQIALRIAGGEAPYTVYFNDNVERPGDIQSLTFDSLEAGVYAIRVEDSNGCSAGIRVEVKEPRPLVAEFVPSSDNDRCGPSNSGCLRVGGGTAPYRFLVWNWITPRDVLPEVVFNATTNTFEIEEAILTDLSFLQPAPNSSSWCIRNAPPGHYLVLIIDRNRCQLLTEIVIPETNALRVRAEVENPTCHSEAGGTVKLHIVGGEAPYQVRFGRESISTEDSVVVFENVAPGSYPTQVFDNRQCVVSLNVIVETPRIQLNLRYVATGDTACVNPSGGTAPYEIEWLNLEEGVVVSNDSCVGNLAPGVYLVTVGDAGGCRAEQILIIDPQPCEGGRAMVRAAAIRSGESATFVLRGHIGVSLQWQFRTEFTGWIDLPGGTTEIFTTPMILTGSPKVIFVRAKVTCANGDVVFSTETAFRVIGDQRLVGLDRSVNDQSLFNPAMRLRTLQDLGIQPTQTNIGTTVYPTISRETVQIRFDMTTNSEVRITVQNELGRLMQQIRLDNAAEGDVTQLSVQNFPPGMYFIRIESDNNAETKRIIVQ
ncbi:MAG TPA: T9SS type A sorting domain-containing protein [Saprospiraceae bacterium]|nr:T9SS type A sorting domain-containing protein [Saprospiraceae bacterium]HMP25018.1 T9SS type A sorting domain-containing protein [Saprospiraceae bacterium]